MNFASPALGEFFGTMVVILLGNGVVAGALLNRSKAQGAGWVAITTGWAVAVFAGVALASAMGDSDAHLNPAVTLGSVLMTGNASRLFTYIPAQLLGAFVGAILVWLHYKPHWAATPEASLKFACFATTPAIRSPLWNFFSELIGTFILVVIAAALFSRRVAPGGLAPGLGPVLIGSLVWGIGLSLGGSTGYAINPARDFGPRLAHSILPIPGKQGSEWNYAWVPILGPLAGAAVAALFVRAFGVT
ncbi:MAG: MIP/aquaporin family protein [Acidobacteriaceae bacterium]